MASVLFLAPADLGETVLASGALAHITGEGDVLTVLCAPSAEALFRGVPGTRVTPIARGEGFGAFVDLAWRQLGRAFDVALDLRGSPAAFVIPAKRRFTRRAPTALCHLAEEFSALVGAERALTPNIRIDDAARTKAAAIAPGPLLVLAPGGVDPAKRWPPERFAAVARRLEGGALAGAMIVAVGAGPRDQTITRSIVSSLDADGVAARDLGAEFDLLDCAALMERATLVIGNDNALTHIAAAAGAPTLTLFGPTDERVRAPFGPRTRTLRGKSLEEIAALPTLDGGVAMEDVSIDAVEAAALDLLNAGGLR